MADQPMDRVVPLDELNDFEIAEGDPDVRGWDVIASDGARIGEVDDLLVDPGALKVRYLDVDLDDDLMANSEDKDRHILIPIGYARLDEDDDKIFVDNLGSAQIRSIPAYNHGPLDPDYESTLRTHLDGDYTTAPAPPPAPYGEFNERDDYEAGSIFGGRGDETEGEEHLLLSEEELEVERHRVEAGEVDIGKHVETRHVEREEPRMHEEAIIEHRPARESMGTAPRIEEGEIHVPLTEEELTVQKRVVPREEIVVRKRQITENEKVEADLRSERADIHREGDARIREEDDRDKLI